MPVARIPELIIRRAHRRRRRAFLWVVAVLLLGLGVNVWLALRPAAIAERVREALARSLHCEFAFDDVSYAFSDGFRLRGLVLREGDDPAVSVDVVRIVPRLGELLFGHFQAERIVLRGVELHVTRSASGDWNFLRLLQPRPPEEAPSGEIPEIVVDTGRIRYEDRASFDREVEVELSDLRIRVSRVRGDESGSRREFSAQFDHPHAGGFRVRGDFLPGPSGDARVELEAYKLELGAPLLRFLPEAAADALDALDLAGAADLVVAARFDDAGFHVDDVRATLLESRFSVPGLPMPVRGARGGLRLDPEGHGAVELEGELADGRVILAAAFAIDPSTFSLREWRGSLRVPEMTAHPGLAEGSAEGLATFLRYLGLSGPVGWEIEVGPSAEWIPPAAAISARVRVLGASLEPHPFPYRFTDARAEFRYEKGVITVEPEARGRMGAGRVTVSKCYIEPRSGGRVELELLVEGCELDHRLRDAIPAEVGRHIWDDAAPRGRGDATISIHRAGTLEDPGSIGVIVEARPTDATVQHRYFPYLLSGIRGRLVIDTFAHEARIVDLRGVHGANQVVATGVVPFDGTKPFELRFGSTAVLLDDDLVAAMPPACQDVIRSLHLRGRADAVTIVRTGAAGGVDVSVGVDIIDAVIEHESLPYAVPLSGGRVDVFGGESVVLEDIVTASTAPVSVDFDGRWRREPEAADSTLEFGAEISGFTIDPEMVGRFPAGIARVLERSGLGGTFSGRLEGRYTARPDREQDEVSYLCTGVRTTDARVDFGLKVSDMRAMSDFHGRIGPGAAAELEGEIYVESARFNILDLREGYLYFTLGKRHPLVTGERRPGKKLPGSSFSLPTDIGQRLGGEAGFDSLQISAATSQFYGGNVEGFLVLDGAERRDFVGAFTGTGIEVARAATDVFGYDGTEATGSASGNVRFGGRIGDIESLSGQGDGRITDAKLAQVPLFHGMLDLLNLSAEGAVFREVSLPFEIKESRFRSEAIKLTSAIMNLEGSGTLDFHGRLDLLLRPVFLPGRIPLFSAFIDLLKDVVARVEVTGPLTGPRVDLRSAGVGIPISDGDSARPKPANAGDDAPKGDG